MVRDLCYSLLNDLEVTHMAALSAKGSLWAGILAAIGASVCCVGPLVLLSLGVSGAWIGNLTAVEPFRPIFIAVTLLFFVLAYRKLYWRAGGCATDAPWPGPRVRCPQGGLFRGVDDLTG